MHQNPVLLVKLPIIFLKNDRLVKIYNYRWKNLCNIHNKNGPFRIGKTQTVVLSISLRLYLLFYITYIGTICRMLNPGQEKWGKTDEIIINKCKSALELGRIIN